MDTATSIIGLVMISVGFVMLVIAVVGLVRWKLRKTSADVVGGQRPFGNA